MAPKGETVLCADGYRRPFHIPAKVIVAMNLRGAAADAEAAFNPPPKETGPKRRPGARFGPFAVARWCTEPRFLKLQRWLAPRG